MSNKRYWKGLHVFSVLLMVVTFSAGCGRNDILSEQANSGGKKDIEYTGTDKSSEEESTAGQAGTGMENAPSEAGTGMENAPSEAGTGMENVPSEAGTDMENMPSEAGTDKGDLPSEGRTNLEDESTEEIVTKDGQIPAEGESTAASPKEGEEQQAESIGSIEPKLPATGTKLSDFVVEGWELLDSVELDFNQDGIVDYVGVQEVPLDKKRDEWWNELSLRVLFAIASEGKGQYRLDFQDANLIRARVEGGMAGDPYDGLEGSGASFTTHAYGGSSDRWSESYTYTYRDGTWYLTASEITSGYANNADYYQKDDWDSGIRICKKRGRTCNQPWEVVHDPGVYELEYEMRLDEPITLYQASRRWWLSMDRITDWEVRDIVFAEGIKLSEDRIIKPEKVYYDTGCIDENYALYTFRDKENEKAYLALYSWQDRTLAVLSEEENPQDYHMPEAVGIYEEKVYYSTAIMELVRYKSTYGGEMRIIEDEKAVGQKVVRMNLDGTEKETIFTYMYPGTDQPVLEEAPPYLGIIGTQISGGEIVLGVYIGGSGPETQYYPYYRMNVDGSGMREIGQVSDEYPWPWEEQ